MKLFFYLWRSLEPKVNSGSTYD